ncbi:MAG: GNAT family N-acetyltransferase [Actinobacteria bacterium]|nr:GNAT family N-acetyltransferase [Actinomycetota bacterium]
MTALVTLRARTEADFDVLYEIASDLDTWEQRSPQRPHALTREAYAARVAERAAGTGGNVEFVIDADDAPVGSVNLFGIDELAHHGEVGIALRPGARGQGIGTQALSQLIEFAFVRGNLRRLHLEVIASNRAAIRSYQKCGFVEEGRLREHAWVRGGYEDIVLMGILRREWIPTRP